MYASVLCKTALIAIFVHCALAFTSPLSLSLRRDLQLTSASRQRHAAVVMKAQDENKISPVSRRLFASLLFAASVGVPKAFALTDEEEFLKLQAEAQRIQSVIDVQKKAFGGVVAGGKPVTTKPTERASSGPNPYMNPHDVVKTMMAALKKNDPKDNSGLKTVLEFTASSNPILENPQYFERMMINSKYSLLLGHFDDFAITSTESYKDGETGQPITLVGMKVMAPYRTMLVCGVPFEDIEYMDDKTTASVCINWQLSKDPKSGSWLSDTMYFKKVEGA